MSRQERKNMITFLSKVKGMEEGMLMVMTDDEIEHIYTRVYDLVEVEEKY